MPITQALLLLNLFATCYGWYDPTFMQRMIHHPYAMKYRQEYYRAFTGAFLHANLLHLFFNMQVLREFGGNVERHYRSLANANQVGSILLLTLCLGAICAASLADYLTHADNAFYRSLGFSSATSALLMSYVAYAPHAPLNFFSIVTLPAWAYASSYLGISAYIATSNPHSGINHRAHFVGSVYGLSFTLFIRWWFR